MSDSILENAPQKQCSIDDCTSPITYKRQGLCRKHYMAQRSEKINILCSTPECGRKVRNVKRGLCQRCYLNWRATQNPDSSRCKVPNCDYPLWAKGYCMSHYQQMHDHGEIRPLKHQKKGRIRKMEGSYLTSSGYKRIVVPGRGHILEHRYVMEQKIGRYLLPGENVHHIDGDKLNNSPENLELWIVSQPQGQRVEDLVAWAKEILQRYGE